jgi:hypothetical protein
MQFETAIMNITAYLVVTHKVRTERTIMIPSPADIIIFHQLFFTSLFVVVDVAGESTPVVLIVVVVSVSIAVIKLMVVVNARCVMSSDRGVEKASRLLAPWVDVVSSPAAEALVADSEDEGEDEGDVSFGGRSPLAVLKLLIVAIFVAAVVVSTKRC